MTDNNPCYILRRQRLACCLHLVPESRMVVAQSVGVFGCNAFEILVVFTPFSLPVVSLHV